MLKLLESLPYRTPGQLFDSLSRQFADAKVHPDEFMPALRNRITSTLDQLLGYYNAVHNEDIDIQIKEWLTGVILGEYTVWMQLDDHADGYFNYLEYAIKYFDAKS